MCQHEVKSFDIFRLCCLLDQSPFLPFGWYSEKKNGRGFYKIYQVIIFDSVFSIAIVMLGVIRHYHLKQMIYCLNLFSGILFSINMLKVLRLPSLKICTILLSTLFVYDIFFVFITPLITKVRCMLDIRLNIIYSALA